MTPSETELLDVLVRAQSLRFLGPGDPADHLSHAVGFRDAVVAHLGGAPDRFCDLGTGGGVPGLVLAALWPDSLGALVESAARRCAALEGWSRDLGIQDRVEVLHGRAEHWAHVDGYRETFQVVTARSFARPGITAEMAAGSFGSAERWSSAILPTLRADRWPEESLANIGFGPARPVIQRSVHFSCVDKLRPADPTIPRSEGKPAKRPLW